MAPLPPRLPLPVDPPYSLPPSPPTPSARRRQRRAAAAAEMSGKGNGSKGLGGSTAPPLPPPTRRHPARGRHAPRAHRPLPPLQRAGRAHTRSRRCCSSDPRFAAALLQRALVQAAVPHRLIRQAGSSLISWSWAEPSWAGPCSRPIAKPSSQEENYADVVYCSTRPIHI
ncbi:unnamed protein product [Urochloa humidicola]